MQVRNSHHYCKADEETRATARKIPACKGNFRGNGSWEGVLEEEAKSGYSRYKDSVSGMGRQARNCENGRRSVRERFFSFSIKNVKFSGQERYAAIRCF